MHAVEKLTELIVRLGAELDFDVERDVAGASGAAADVVWFQRSLPLAAVRGLFEDPADAPVLPSVAFALRAPDEGALLAAHAALARVRARLEVLVIARADAHSALAPVLRSVDQLGNDTDDAALRARVRAQLRDAGGAGRAIVMLKSELVEWASRVRSARPRSYSAESLFERTGDLD